MATLIVERYLARSRRRRFLLGCPGGRSLVTSYAALAEQARRRSIDLSDLVIVMMDEYVDAHPTEFVAVDDSLPHSCRRFGQEEILDRLNTGRVAADQVPADQLWLPDAADPAAYEDRIAAEGGVDIFLLASGAGDGHVAFNPPGTAAAARTRVVELPESTRRDNLVTFPTFGGDLDLVPAYGVTVGVATIREHSREVVMVLHGADKQLAARHLISAEHYDPDWPATVMVECRAPSLYLDHRAAGDLPTPAS